MYTYSVLCKKCTLQINDNNLTYRPYYILYSLGVSEHVLQIARRLSTLFRALCDQDNVDTWCTDRICT